MSFEEEEFRAICDGFLKMLIEKYPGLNYEEQHGGFTFLDRSTGTVGVTFYTKKMLISSKSTALYFDYSDPECFNKAIAFCDSMHPMNVAKGFEIER